MTKHWDDEREQDWEPLVIRRTNNNQVQVPTETSDKFQWHFINVVKQSRLEKGWTRKFLSGKLTIKEEKMESFEKGELLFDNKLRADLIRVLGLKL